jgi:hypothetical protein
MDVTSNIVFQVLLALTTIYYYVLRNKITSSLVTWLYMLSTIIVIGLGCYQFGYSIYVHSTDETNRTWFIISNVLYLFMFGVSYLLANELAKVDINVYGMNELHNPITLQPSSNQIIRIIVIIYSTLLFIVSIGIFSIFTSTSGYIWSIIWKMFIIIRAIYIFFKSHNINTNGSNIFLMGLAGSKKNTLSQLNANNNKIMISIVIIYCIILFFG